MVKNEKSSATAPRAGRRQLFEWVEDRLRPAFESPAVTEHTIEHSAHDTILNCPVPHPGAWDRDAFEPVNEYGMVVHRPPQEPEVT
jgi:hypothetical protein